MSFLSVWQPLFFVWKCTRNNSNPETSRMGTASKAPAKGESNAGRRMWCARGKITID